LEKVRVRLERITPIEAEPGRAIAKNWMISTGTPYGFTCFYPEVLKKLSEVKLDSSEPSQINRETVV
jgi:hypothetical protein